MKVIFTIGFLFFVITQTFAQNSVDIEAIRSYVSANSPKENERLVNEIDLLIVAFGHECLGPMQIEILYDIAHQCPDLGGTAVYRARSIYALIDVEIYNDNCSAFLKSSSITSNDTCHLDVHFVNPSLEGVIFTYAPYQWVACESTPDIHPTFGGYPASDGLTYTGVAAAHVIPQIIESFGSQLIEPLIMGESYKFLFDFASWDFAGSTWGPGSISMWLGDALCGKQQLIYAGTTSDTLWGTHLVEFVPNDNYSYFIISSELNSAFENYSLIDNLRSIPQPFGCDTAVTIGSLPPDRTDTINNGVYTNVTVTESSEFKIYPNPNTQGILMVEWTIPIQGGKLVLIDAVGRQVGQYVVENNSVSQQIDIQTLPSGYYTILLEADKKVWGREKLIVIKQ